MRADETDLLCHITFVCVRGKINLHRHAMCHILVQSECVRVAGLVFCFYTCQVKLAASPRNCYTEKETTGEE